jgi:hypothetical protein
MKKKERKKEEREIKKGKRSRIIIFCLYKYKYISCAISRSKKEYKSIHKHRYYTKAKAVVDLIYFHIKMCYIIISYYLK